MSEQVDHQLGEKPTEQGVRRHRSGKLRLRRRPPLSRQPKRDTPPEGGPIDRGLPAHDSSPGNTGILDDRGRSDGESGRPVQLGGDQSGKPRPTSDRQEAG
jgi:hypothetical protein